MAKNLENMLQYLHKVLDQQPKRTVIMMYMDMNSKWGQFRDGFGIQDVDSRAIEGCNHGVENNIGRQIREFMEQHSLILIPTQD